MASVREETIAMKYVGSQHQCGGRLEQSGMLTNEQHACVERKSQSFSQSSRFVAVHRNDLCGSTVSREEDGNYGAGLRYKFPTHHCSTFLSASHSPFGTHIQLSVVSFQTTSSCKLVR